MPANGIFVFGSNTEGKHGLGAALTAKKEFGAKYGQAKGPQGQSYAVRTKMYQDGNLVEYNNLTEENKKQMDLMTIEDLRDLRFEALKNPDKKYYVTLLGTKLAGRTVQQMKDFFQRMDSRLGIPDNIILPKEFEVRAESSDTQLVSPEELDNIMPIEDLSVSLPEDLGMDNLEFMKDLEKEERVAYRKLMNDGTFKIKCNG